MIGMVDIMMLSYIIRKVFFVVCDFCLFLILIYIIFNILDLVEVFNYKFFGF